MSANTVTVAASAVSATSTASLAATITITAASIRAAASIAASIAQRSHQWHSDAISMHVASTRWYTYGTIWNRENINGTLYDAVERAARAAAARTMRAYKDGGPTQGAR